MKLQYDEPLSIFAFNFNLRRYRLAQSPDTRALTAVDDPHHDPPSSYTYAELEARMSDFSRGLANRGVRPTDRVALFAEASARWLIADGGRPQQMLLATS